MSVNVLYKTQAKATGGRDGHAATLDGALDVKLTTPKELGGSGGAGNNPEQLFAAGYAACFIGAMKFVASQGGRRCPRTPPSPRPSVSARVRKAALASISTSRSRCPALPRRTRKRWWQKRTRCAPIPTPPAAMWMCA